MRSFRISQMLILGVFAAATAACAGDPADPADTNDVHTPGTAFSPPSLTIDQGEAVLFHIQRSNGEDHNVDFDPVAGAPADIPTVGDTTVSRTFTTVGTFPYACTVHVNMTGEIVVQ